MGRFLPSPTAPLVSRSRRSLLGHPPRMLPARSALGVTSPARSRPAAGERCTAAPRSRVPGVAGLRAPEQRRLRLPAAAAGAAPSPVAGRAAPPCGGRDSRRGSLSAWRLPCPSWAASAPVGPGRGRALGSGGGACVAGAGFEWRGLEGFDSRLGSAPGKLLHPAPLLGYSVSPVPNLLG
jgi:hypothetical protein